MKCEALGGLYIPGAKVTDAGMVHVSKLTSLVILDLKGTAVTDKGLLELSNLELLRVLVVSGTKVTAEGRDALQASLRDLRIVK